MVARGTAPYPLVREWHLGAGVPGAACGWTAGLGRSVSGWDKHPGASEGGWRKRGAQTQALGRSRGGYGTKACAACDARGRPLAFALLAGQASELTAAPLLLAAVAALGQILRVVCDRGYSAMPWRRLIRDSGAEPVVPAQPTHKSAPPYDRAAYRRRHRVENLWARLKECRAVATRYEKTAKSYLGDLHLAAALDWLSNGP